MRASDSRFGGLEQGGRTPALVTLLAGWVVLAWPWLSGRVTVPWDAKAHFLPQLQFLAASFARGESPFWLPFAFSGHPQIADPQSLIFAPPFFLLALIDEAPTAWAADVTLFAMLLGSAGAMLLWLTDKGWHPAAALLSALSFAFGAAMAWRIQHVGQVMSLAYLPLVLFCLDRALVRRSATYAFGAGLAAACLVLGRDQVALLSVYFLIAYLISNWLQAGDRGAWFRTSVMPIGVAAVTGVLVIAIPIVLTLLVTADSNRPSIDLEGAGRGSLHPALFLTIFAADVFGSSGAMGEYWGPPSGRWNDTGLYIAQNMGQLYLGALPALLLVWGGVTGALWQREVRIFTGALVIMILYGLGWYTPVFGWIHGLVPGVDLFRRPADAVFLIGFLASVLAGYVLHRLIEQRQDSEPFNPLAIAATATLLLSAFVSMLILAVHFGMFATAWQGIAVPALLTLGAAAAVVFIVRDTRLAPKLIVALVAVFLTGDLAWSNRPGGATGLPPETYSVLDPATDNEIIALLKRKTAESQSGTRRDRIEIVGFGFHWPNASLTHRLENTLGYNPLRLGPYARATGAADHAGLPEQREFSALFPSYRSLLADLLGLRYIATSVPVSAIDKHLEPGDLIEIAHTRDGYIYENPRALPRVVFATSARHADFDTMMTTGAWPQFDALSTVLLEADIRSVTRTPGSARIVEYSTTRITLEADSRDSGWVVLNDIWQPWWFAAVDGMDTPVLRANVLFRAVAVPPGRHTIIFTFEPVRGALKQLTAER